MPNACVPADKSPKALAMQPTLARMRARPLSNWPRAYCTNESPNQLCAVLIHELRVVVFYRCSRVQCFWTLVKWLQIVDLQKISRRKCDSFFRLLSCQTIIFLEFLAYLYPIIIQKKDNQNNSACQSNQALIEK